MVIVTIRPSSTPDVVPVMLTPVLALVALIRLSAAMPICPGMELIAIVGGGGGGAGCLSWSWGTSMSPELAAVVLMVTWSDIAPFSGRLKFIGWSCSGLLKVGLLDPPGAG